MVKTLLQKAAWLSCLATLAYGLFYCWVSLPLATGYGAKILGSALFVAGRAAKDVQAQELGFLPVNLVSYDINYQDSSLTSSLWGLARQKAIFRKGLGVTLVRQISAYDISRQAFRPPAALPEAPAHLPWPAGDKTLDRLPPGIDAVRLTAALEDTFKDQDTLQDHTRAVVVVYKGQLIAEKYARGFTHQSRLAGWSMTKSIVNALIGILVQQNKLRLDAPAPVPEWQQPGDARQAITVRHLLTHTSGLDFEEDYDQSSDVTRMLFQKADMGAYAASQPPKYPPGTVFQYASGNTNILSRLIRHLVGEAAYHAFPYEQLFYKTAMFSALLEPDASGTFVGSSYCYATARDWARFGLLYLNDGIAGQERLLPAGWVQQSIRPHPAAPQGKYGLHFWLNAGEQGKSANRVFPGLPSDMFYTSGFEGQHIFIFPSQQLLVVRLGFTRKGRYAAENLLNNILRALPERPAR